MVLEIPPYPHPHQTLYVSFLDTFAAAGRLSAVSPGRSDQSLLCSAPAALVLTVEGNMCSLDSASSHCVLNLREACFQLSRWAECGEPNHAHCLHSFCSPSRVTTVNEGFGSWLLHSTRNSLPSPQSIIFGVH